MQFICNSVYQNTLIEKYKYDIDSHYSFQPVLHDWCNQADAYSTPSTILLISIDVFKTIFYKPFAFKTISQNNQKLITTDY